MLVLRTNRCCNWCRLWVNNDMGLHIAMVVLRKQLHRITEHVHDYHHDEHSLHVIGLMCVVLLDEWLGV